MKIFVGTSNHPLRNLGDVAMRQMCVRRLHEAMPDAQIKIITGDIKMFHEHLPGENPVDSDGERTFMRGRIVPIPQRLLTRSGFERMDRIECEIRERFPRLAYRVIRALSTQNKMDPVRLDQFMQAVCEADAVVISGGGCVTDPFPEAIRNHIGFIRAMQNLGKPTAMFGQGLGPLTNPQFRKRAAPVLASLDWLTLREKKMSVPLLKELGVSLDHVTVTGDDALPMGYEQRRESLGQGLGVNVRVADYADVPASAFPALRDAFATISERKGAPLVPVPVYTRPCPEDDHASIAKACEGLLLTPAIHERLSTAEGLVRRIGECRVVVTGSYHAGVFALGQGIPIIGLARTPYYAGKFEGLADMFPGGCDVAFLDSPDLRNELVRLIENRWQTADDTRAQILKSAEQQVVASRAAYARFASELPRMIESRR